ncbi:MAG: hypothetical protein NTW50_00280 [Candidatus Berkelbacteria bacterium]|nr:hypothetical protein [Candidatus Berkelbacteria bacterium]
MTKNYSKNQQQDIISTIFLGIFKLLWWLISLPFRGIRWGRAKSGLSVADRNFIARKRLEIEQFVDSQSVIEQKHAVMEADKLVDYVLKAKGYRGETFADRLRNAESYINQNLYQEIWQGHKIRNQIAHETENQISQNELRGATEKLLKYIRQI